MSGLKRWVTCRAKRRIRRMGTSAPRYHGGCGVSRDVLRFRAIMSFYREPTDAPMLPLLREVCEGHEDSSGKYSGSSAIRSRVSASSVRPIMPYAFRIGLSTLLTITLTRLPSFQSSGDDGCRTPL